MSFVFLLPSSNFLPPSYTPSSTYFHLPLSFQPCQLMTNPERIGQTNTQRKKTASTPMRGMPTLVVWRGITNAIKVLHLRFSSLVHGQHVLQVQSRKTLVRIPSVLSHHFWTISPQIRRIFKHSRDSSNKQKISRASSTHSILPWCLTKLTCCYGHLRQRKPNEEEGSK